MTPAEQHEANAHEPSPPRHLDDAWLEAFIADFTRPLDWRDWLNIACCAIGRLVVGLWLIYLAGLVVTGDASWPATWWRG